MVIREIEERDNAQVEALIRYCLIEFEANHEGTAWMDPDLGRFSEVYAPKASCYWVALEGERVLGGVGIGPLPGERDVCELQKMYCYPEARGTGIAQQLMDLAMDFARKHYQRCYLETLDNMVAAHRFYEKNGFTRTDEIVGDRDQMAHSACDIHYVRDL